MIQKFIISLNYKGHVIKEYFGSHSNFEWKFMSRGSLLGMGGALSLIDTDRFNISFKRRRTDGTKVWRFA